MMRFLFAKRRDFDPPRPPQASPNSGRDAAGASYPRRDTKLVAEGREIEAKFAAAVRLLPVKTAANLTGTTDPTAKAWRTRNAPRFVAAMFLARRVSRIRNAVMEIIGGNDLHKNRLLNVMFVHLSEIASGPDEISAAKARVALKEFAELRKSLDHDGDAI